MTDNTPDVVDAAGAPIEDPTASWSFETKQIHVGGRTPTRATRARALPIYQTTSYDVPRAPTTPLQPVRARRGRATSTPAS